MELLSYVCQLGNYYTVKPIEFVIKKGLEVCPSFQGQPQQVLIKETLVSLPPDMKKWIAIAGLMGASAVAIGAYGVSNSKYSNAKSLSRWVRSFSID